MGLALLDDLDAVLHRAQEDVRLPQDTVFFDLDQPLPIQDLQGLHGVFFTQCRVFSGIDELQGLDEKLDFPDPAPSQLEVALPLLLPGQAAVDLLFHHLDILDHAVIEVPPVDEGLQVPEQGLPQGEGPCHRPRLQQRRTLPALPPALVVDLGAAQGVGHIAAVSLRAQSQVDPEDKAVLGRLAHRPGDHLPQFDEVLVQVDAVAPLSEGSRRPGGPPLLGGIEIDEVDVRGEVQFPSAEFAHPQDGELRLGGAVGRRLIQQRGAVVTAQQNVAHLVGALQGGGGQGGEFGGDLGKLGQGAEVAATDAENLPGLVHPQALLQFCEGGRQGNPVPEFGQHGLLVLGPQELPGNEEVVEEMVTAEEDGGEKGGCAEDGQETPPSAGIGQKVGELASGDDGGEPL